MQRVIVAGGMALAIGLAAAGRWQPQCVLVLGGGTKVKQLNREAPSPDLAGLRALAVRDADIQGISLPRAEHHPPDPRGTRKRQAGLRATTRSL